MESRPLWRCPQCGRTFAQVHQTHTCAPLRSLDAHFLGKDPTVRAVFDAIVQVVQSLGPVAILPEKTRIALHVRMSFAAFMPRRHWLDGHLVLARQLPPHTCARSRSTPPATSSTPSACTPPLTSMPT